MSAPLSARVVPGEAAGMGASAVGHGNVSGGAFAVVTGAEPVAGNTGGNSPSLSLVDVTLTADQIASDLPASTVFTVTQVTGAGLGATLATTILENPGQGFSVIPSVAPAASTMYVFTYA